MNKQINSIWINSNPSFQKFETPLIRYLSRHTTIARWEYYQDQDEPCSLDIALVLLHDYLKSLSQPIHLIGHSTGGLLGLLYARKYPHKVKSLTLLGVGFYPAVDWQCHYYALRQLLPCSREIVLAQMVQKIFGDRGKYNARGLVDILQRDLDTSPSPHSLHRIHKVTPEGVPVPLMVCGSQNDVIVDINSLRGWQDYLKSEDILWECPQGYHFFHYFYPKEVGRQVLKFWNLPAFNPASPSSPTVCQDTVNSEP